MAYLVKFTFEWLVAQVATQLDKYYPVHEKLDWNIRQDFRQLVLPEVVAERNHPHGDLAAERRMVRRNLAAFVCGQGYEPYFVQCSEGQGPGSLVRFWDTDLKVETRIDRLRATSVLIIIDVPYFDPAVLAGDTGLPVLTYDPSPISPANSSGTFHWFTKPNGEVHFNANGGGEFVHKVWDWNLDKTASKTRLCGIPVAVTYSNVDVRRTSDHHVLALITPYSRAKYYDVIAAMFSLVPASWFALRKGKFSKVPFAACSAALGFVSFVHWFQGLGVTREMQHLDLLATSTDVARLDEFTKGERVSRLAMVGQHRCETVLSRDLEAMIGHRLNTGKQLGVTSIRTLDSTAGPETNNVIIVRYLETLRDGHSPVTTNYKTVNFSYSWPTLEESVGRGGYTLMQGLFGPSMAPMNTRANQEIMVDERVLKVRNRCVPPQECFLWADEFVEDALETARLAGVRLVYENAHDLGEGITNPRSKQDYMAYIENGAHDLPGSRPTTLRSFMKGEHYPTSTAGKAKPPRVITTMGKGERWQYLTYYRGVHQIVNAQGWYGFKSPSDIEDKVASVAFSPGCNPAGTDFVKWDGHQGVLGEYAFGRLIKRGWAELGQWGIETYSNHSATINELVTRRKNRKAGVRHPDGITGKLSYDTELSQLSGWQDTSDANTFNNGLNTYTYLRSEGIDRVKARAILNRHCLFGGDDGLINGAFVHITGLVEWSGRNGLPMEEEIFPRTGPVSFLGRRFMPHGASVVSASDPERAAVKLTMTTAAGMRNNKAGKEYLLALKCCSILITDPHTPVVADFAETYVRAFNKTRKRLPDTFTTLAGVRTEYERLGLEVPWHLRSMKSWHTAEDAELNDVLQEEVENKFNYVAFLHWLTQVDRAGSTVRDPVSYLRRAPCFGLAPGELNDVCYLVAEEAVDCSESLSDEGGPEGDTETVEPAHALAPVRHDVLVI